MIDREDDSNSGNTGNPYKRERETSSSSENSTPLKKHSTMAPNIAATIATLTNTVKELQSTFTVQLAELQKTFNQSFGNWQAEKTEILRRQAELETRLDRIERQEKRNNIVITGLITDQTNVKSTVNDFLNKQLKQNVSVIDAFEIKLETGKSKIIVKLASFNEKLNIIKAKKDLDDNIFISDDLIKKDQFIQYKAREFAKAARKIKKEAKVGSRKVYVDGILHVWDESTETFTIWKN